MSYIMMARASRPKKALPKNRVKIRKDGGDDLYSWALFIDGKMKWNGMDRNEAEWRKRGEIAELEALEIEGGQA